MAVVSSGTGRLAAHAAGLAFGQLPPAAVDAAKIIVLDTLGAMLLGSAPAYDGARIVGEMVAAFGGAPECTIVGRGFRTDVASAALVNGVLGYQADAEGAGVARQHAAAVLVPVTLSLGERERASGRRLIAALAAGYDVAGRIDRAAEPGHHFAHSFHPSAVFGHFGAAAAAANLFGLDADRTENALGLAGMTAGGLAVWIQAEREDSRPYVIGMAAYRGVLAALLAGLGMGGPRGIAEDGKYTIYDAFTGAVQIEELDRDLGERFLIAEHSGFKRYPCCGGGGIHASIAAVLKLVREHGLDASQIDAIVDRVTPETGVGVPLKSHSTEYLLAVAAARREIAPDAIVVDYRARDAQVARLYRRVEIVHDAALAARNPGAAVVELRLRDGRVLREAVAQRPGSPADPLPPEEIEAKFLRYATTRLPYAHAVKVRDLVARLEELPDVAELAGLLAVPEP